MPEEATRFLIEAEAWIAERGWGPLIERKPFGLAVHGRGKDPMMFSVVRVSVQEGLGAAALQAGCDIVSFDGGIELRPRAHQKGSVVETLAAEEGPGAVLAYLGDDLTDEDAFRAVAGRGLAVLVRERERPTSADLWIRPPGELLWFLDEWERAQAAPAGTREAVP
jgi:trehalose-phosphatase